MDSTLSNPARQLLQEQQAAQALLESLQQEQACLVAADGEQTAAISVEKSRLVAELASLTRNRYAALAAQGQTADESGMRAWLVSSGQQSARALWQQLIVLATEARELNRTNGLLIGRQLARNQAALTALRSAAGGTASTSFYGPDGQATTSSLGQRYISG